MVPFRSAIYQVWAYNERTYVLNFSACIVQYAADGDSRPTETLRNGISVVKALDGINIDIEEGERIVLLGPSGSGKTTLLNCVAALDSPTAGSYSFDGKDVPRENSEEMTTFRRENIGYVFQFFNLLQDLTVLENILLIQELSGERNKDRALELLKLVGLEKEMIDSLLK